MVVKEGRVFVNQPKKDELVLFLMTLAQQFNNNSMRSHSVTRNAVSQTLMQPDTDIRETLTERDRHLKHELTLEWAIR